MITNPGDRFATEGFVFSHTIRRYSEQSLIISTDCDTLVDARQTRAPYPGQTHCERCETARFNRAAGVTPRTDHVSI